MIADLERLRELGCDRTRLTRARNAGGNSRPGADDRRWPLSDGMLGPSQHFQTAMHSMPSRKRRTAIAVALGFAAFIAISTSLSFVAGLFPSQEEDCSKRCHAVGLRGEMVPIYPPAQTAGMRGHGPSECKCQ